MTTLEPWLIPGLIGIASGLLAALCGVGGGIVMVPAFVIFLLLDQKHATATSMAVIVPTAIAATYKHWQNDLIDWRVFLATAVTATLTSFVAADAVKNLKSETLSRLFAVVIIVIGVKMLVWPSASSAPKPAPAPAVADVDTK